MFRFGSQNQYLNCIYVNNFKNPKGDTYMVPNNFALSDTQSVIVSLQQALVLIFHANSQETGPPKEFAHITVINMLWKS